MQTYLQMIHLFLALSRIKITVLKILLIFLRKKYHSAHPNTFFNDIPVKRAPHQKHLEIYLNDI